MPRQTAIADGLGRVIQTQLNSDPQGADLVDTTYDGLGRVHTTSNPHRSGSSPTDGTTTYSYDALGRAIITTEQDGSVVSTSYSGNCSTASDETGKKRKSCADGLGRLVQVFEDPAGLNYETDYSYDALNNLLQVVQKGGTTDTSQWRNRTFAYDSLSRLLSATNPESGTITYTYDASGNVLTKTDARGIVASMAYDQLNRITQKSYSDGTPTSEGQLAEYGGRVYMNTDGKTYSYTTPVTQGKNGEVDPDAGMGLGNRLPTGTTNAGEYHTHPDTSAHCCAQEGFSGPDGQRAVNQHIPTYILAPKGLVYKLDGTHSNNYMTAPQSTWPVTGPIPK